MSFDTERFIIEIENKECLWNTASSTYKDCDDKLKCWENISKQFNTQWENQTEKERDLFSKYLIIIIFSLIYLICHILILRLKSNLINIKNKYLWVSHFKIS